MNSLLNFDFDCYYWTQLYGMVFTKHIKID